MEFEREAIDSVHRTYCMILGNYGGHLAYAMDSPVLHSLCIGFCP